MSGWGNAGGKECRSNFKKIKDNMTLGSICIVQVFRRKAKIWEILLFSGYMSKRSRVKKSGRCGRFTTFADFFCDLGRKVSAGHTFL